VRKRRSPASSSPPAATHTCEPLAPTLKAWWKDLDDHSEQYDFLGANSYLANERPAANEIMILAYFRARTSLHAWAHAAGGVHREAWSYWNTEVMGKGKTEEGRMFSIMHEAYQVPARKWENVYVNYHPSALGATTCKVNLRSSQGRMAVSSGNDHEKYGDDPYANEKA
jgi:hypothetical protein